MGCGASTAKVLPPAPPDEQISTLATVTTQPPEDGTQQSSALARQPTVRWEFLESSKPVQDGGRLDADGKHFEIKQKFGDGFFGTLHTSRRRLSPGSLEAAKSQPSLAAEEGKEYAVKEVKQAGIKGSLVKDFEKQCKELAIEGQMQMWLREQYAGPSKAPAQWIPQIALKRVFVRVRSALTDLGGCLVPNVAAMTKSTLVMEQLDAVMFQTYLREIRHFDAPDAADVAANMKAVCWVVVYKVARLLMRLRESNFSHRDCQDNNVMIKIHTPVVTKPDDVSVYLIDFGKSMAIIDGEMVANGIYDPKDSSKYISPYNATTDTVRLIMSIQRSLLKAYETAKWDASKGKWEVRQRPNEP